MAYTPTNQLSISRAQLFDALKDENLVRQFEKVLQQVADTNQASTATVAATSALQDATAITLSPNDALNNERVLAVVSPLALHDNGPGNTLVLGFVIEFTINGSHALVLNLLGDTNVTLPPSGTLMTTGAGTPSYANDAAAAAAGYAIGDIYKQPSGVVAWRQV